MEATFPPSHTSNAALLDRAALQIGTPRTHQRFLNRIDGTYGPIPSKAPWGIVTMPLNT